MIYGEVFMWGIVTLTVLYFLGYENYYGLCFFVTVASWFLFTKIEQQIRRRRIKRWMKEHLDL